LEERKEETKDPQSDEDPTDDQHSNFLQSLHFINLFFKTNPKCLNATNTNALNHITPRPLLPLTRLCHNQRETTPITGRNRLSGDEALDLPARSPALRDEGRAETFHCSASGLQANEKNPISKKADYP
jgi:hypothetical protein